MHDVWVGLFHLIQEDQAVRVAADLFGQLAGLFVTDVTRGGPDQLGSRGLVHVFGHVKADHGVLGTKEQLRQLLSGFGLPNPGWPDEEEGADWPAGLV